MAALPVLAPLPIDAGGHGAPAPHIPLADCNGTITKWLVTKIAVDSEAGALGSEILIQELNTAYGRFEQLAELDAGEETKNFFVEFAQDIITSHEFNGFLCAYQEGDEAKVVVLHSLRRFSLGIGASAQFSGRTFGFLGDCHDDQLPQLVILSADEGRNLPGLLALDDVMLPSDAAITAFLQILCGMAWCQDRRPMQSMQKLQVSRF